MVGDIGGAPDLVLVAAHQVAVLGGHQVLLHHVGAEVERELVGAEGVLGPVPAGAPVADHGRHGKVPVAAGAVAAAPGRRGGSRRARGDRARGRQDRRPQDRAPRCPTLRHECHSSLWRARARGLRGPRPDSAWRS
ncbi:hypothetical protein GCM10020254_66590 [Streptomyces goshikiensis]